MANTLYSVTIENEAFSDINQLVLFYLHQSQDIGLAQRVEDAIYDAIDALEIMPMRCVLYRKDPPLYKLTLNQFPIIIYFVIDKQSHIVQIVHVYHGASNHQPNL